jgi:hypothetical protein
MGKVVRELLSHIDNDPLHSSAVAPHDSYSRLRPICSVRSSLLPAIFTLPSPGCYRPLPSDLLEYCWPCLFATCYVMLKRCHLLYLAKPSLGCHIVRYHLAHLVSVPPSMVASL